jgi:hypothetical protein
VLPIAGPQAARLQPEAVGRPPLGQVPGRESQLGQLVEPRAERELQVPLSEPWLLVRGTPEHLERTLWLVETPGVDVRDGEFVACCFADCSDGGGMEGRRLGFGVVRAT